VVDRPYVDAILKDPAARLGKPSSMPAYPALTETEREALLKFLESVGTAPPPTPAGAPMQHEGHESKPAGKPADKDKPHAEHP
jgi:hypothetical protein